MCLCSNGIRVPEQTGSQVSTTGPGPVDASGDLRTYPFSFSFSLVHNWDWTCLSIRSLNLKDPVTEGH